MKQAVSLYLQKLIGLALVILASIFAYQYIELYAIIPLALIVYSTIYAQIMKKKAPYLFNLKKVDDYLNKKGGFWHLFKVLLIFLGIVYDIVIWVVWSIYLVFEIVIDFILLVKEIIFWIIHSLLWFLNLFVPAFVFLYRLFLYYVVGWIWWLYRVSFRKVVSSVKLNYFLLALCGGILSTFSVLLFYYFDILFGTNQLVFIGVVLAALPLAWTYGEIASVNENNLQKEPYYEVSANYRNGIEAVKYVLYYVVGFLILFTVQVLLNLLGWIPDVGLVFLGFALSINTLISLILVFLFVIILFATAIIPSHLIKTEEQETPFHDMINFLSIILKKGLQYVLVTLPNAIFGLLLMIIPALLVFGAVAITFTIKNDVLERRINQLEKNKNSAVSAIQEYQLKKKIDKLNYYIDFPVGIVQDMKDRKLYNEYIVKMQQSIEDQNATNAKLKVEYSAKVKDLEYKKEQAKNISNSNEQIKELESINVALASLKDQFANDLEKGEYATTKTKTDIQYWLNRKKQLPISFLFVIIWASLFIGIIVAIYHAFMGNVYYDLYVLKSEGPTYFSELVKETKSKNRTQPLLGFTLLSIVVIILFSVFSGL